MNNCRILYDIKSLEALIVRTFLCDNDFKVCENKNFPTPTQLQIIEYILDRKSDVYQRDLEDVLNLRRATVSGVLQTMEKNFLIKRLPSEKDARVKRIILNPETRNLFLKHKSKLQEIESIITKDISKSDIKAFSNVLVAMRKNINEYLSEQNTSLKKGDK